MAASSSLRKNPPRKFTGWHCKHSLLLRAQKGENRFNKAKTSLIQVETSLHLDNAVIKAGVLTHRWELTMNLIIKGVPCGGV